MFINMAISADGKIATANRAVHSFGSTRDLQHLYELRATADAVMCGARTVEISQATLGNGGEKFRRQRLKNKRSEYPLRVIVTGSGSIDPAAKLFQKRFSPIIVLTTRRAPAKKLAQLRENADEVRICGDTEINFRTTLRWLFEKWNVKRLLCEGGGELNDALFRAGLVDEVHLTICPKIFGGRNAPTIADGEGFQRLAKAGEFKIVAKKAIKGELFTAFRRKKAA
ncbi:MAG TPA: dihydrofolate reductase family protein [Verrucomicrobiae bacterium]|nr:dihydrofolate reductase family protein [Verrucomicrobiae bacterium]